MRHQKEEILLKAKAIMAAIGWTYDLEESPVAFYNSKEDYYEEWKNMPDFNKYKDRIKADWVVSFNFPPEDEIYKNTMFLEIDDETGEPNEIRHKQATFKFIKKVDGWELEQTR